MKVFFHNDMDGKCAANIVLKLEPDCETGTCFIAMNYGMDFPFEHIGKDEVVYILDFSIEPEDMTKLLAITENVIWIDHHKTAIEKYSEFAWRNKAEEWCNVHDIDGIRMDSAAGCVHTYYYFRPYQHSTMRKPDWKPIPEYILLVGDRDTWTWEYGKRTKFFHAGLEAEDMYPNSPIWDVLRADGKSKVDQIVKVGGYIQRYKDRTEQEYVSENGFWVKLYDGSSTLPYTCYAVNGKYSSEPFEVAVPEADIWMPFRYMKAGYWMVSLYTNKDIDVSEIASKYEYHGKRGGGHKQAAGFECEYPPFLNERSEDAETEEG